VQDEKQWYSNKDLFEQMQGLKDELTATKEVIAKYNGLYDKVNDVQIKLSQQVKRCDEVQAGKEARSDIYSTLLKLWPILLSTLIFILSMTNII
jgi:hypothetical protein